MATGSYYYYYYYYLLLLLLLLRIQSRPPEPKSLYRLEILAVVEHGVGPPIRKLCDPMVDGSRRPKLQLHNGDQLCQLVQHLADRSCRPQARALP
jgi:hypothetical protein